MTINYSWSCISSYQRVGGGSVLWNSSGRRLSFLTSTIAVEIDQIHFSSHYLLQSVGVVIAGKGDCCDCHFRILVAGDVTKSSRHSFRRTSFALLSSSSISSLSRYEANASLAETEWKLRRMVRADASLKASSGLTVAVKSFHDDHGVNAASFHASWML